MERCYPGVVTTTNLRVAIVGGGITGLATAAWLEHDHDISDVVVFEAADRPGGKIRSEISDGHCIEWGPQGFLDNAPDTLELAAIAGLGKATVAADDASADRYILRSGVLRSVPLKPLAFLGSDILPLIGKLRVLGEPLSRSRPASEETVFDFARRRIGRQAAEVLVDAMVTGVFAGDSRQLSLAATFPRMAAMEAEHGSLTRAMFAKMREARREGRRSGGPAGPGGTLTTFEAGMDQLPTALANRLDSRLMTGARVHGLERTGGGFTLRWQDSVGTADGVVLVTPAATTAELLAETAPAAVQPLKEMTTAPIAVVMTSYARADQFPSPPRGFGFLVPRGEDVGILGTLFCHAIFPRQAPTDAIFLRTMLGGARDPAAVDLDDDALVSRTRLALRKVLGVDPDPDRLWVVRWEEGISQYTLGHLERVAGAEQAARTAGVELAGSPYRGVSVNDCIRQARAVARRVAERLAGESGS